MLAGRCACVSMGAAGTMPGSQERHLPVCSLTAPTEAYALIDTRTLNAHSPLTPLLTHTAESHKAPTHIRQKQEQTVSQLV